ncbi:FecCD family ABC transporter permease [Gordonia hydrophobica]|uniref:Iron chelate uptake ABC transporter family permease subunit n=1 Tax=Gordonia hydrophobica TaxID=40516 RepID=A0ABZ2U033_9ACTN|nr:iron chelate uptake ABC transporter family permease subunit [Gordonia hydrophobica]MBM7369399.1 iron complex transport system permease protein [Gordonia hydrophobica]
MSDTFLEPATDAADTRIRRTPRRAWLILPLSVFALFVVVVLSLSLGARATPIGAVIEALFGIGDTDVANIVGVLRVNRTITGVISGAALAVAGVLMQAITRNPIADPGILGVNAGASFGVVVGLAVLGSAGVGNTLVFALAGAFFASGVVLMFSASRFVAGSPVRLTLAGVAFAAVLSGVTHSVILLDEAVLDSFRFWRVGSLAARTASEALPVVWIVVVGLVGAFALSSALNAMALGDDTARALGVRPGLVRAWGLVAIALLCGAATAIVGPIAFLGLAVPHLVRALVGPDLRLVIPVSLIVGPCLLLTADILGRLVGQGQEVPVGVLTALIGGPVLIAFVVGARRSALS